MAWVILFAAGVLEIGWAAGLKLSDGLSRPLPAAITIVAMLASVGLLGLSMKTLPLGTAYAVWTGIGTLGTVLVGILLFGESAAPARIICIGLIAAGILGLKLTGEG